MSSASRSLQRARGTSMSEMCFSDGKRRSPASSAADGVEIACIGFEDKTRRSSLLE
jgi:hypothetical protein